MAWHTPKTWKPHDSLKLTAAVLNYELRDLLLYLYTNIGGITPGTWTAFGAMSNSWANVGGSEQDAEYILENGWVSLRGYITGGTLNALIWSLPVGHWPPAPVRFPVVTDGGSTGAFGYLKITQFGSIALVSGTNVNVDLSPVRFSIT